MVQPVRLALGLVCVAITVVASVAFTFLVQSLGTSTGSQWDKPWFEVTVYHGCWVLLLPVAALWQWLAMRRDPAAPRLPVLRLLAWGFTGGPLLVCAAFLNYLALSRQPLYFNTVLSNSLFVFVFAGSAVVLRERVTLAKVGGCLLCCAGLALLGAGQAAGATASPIAAHDIILGYVFISASLLLSAVYYILWCRVMAPVAAAFGLSPLLALCGLGAIGLATCALGWIGLVVGHCTGLEPFAWPRGPAATRVLVNCALDVAINAANLAGALFVSASFVQVGALLSIPAAMGTQALFAAGGAAVNALQGAGLGAVVAGALTFELGDAGLQAVRRKRAAGGAPDATAGQEAAPLIN